MNVGASTSRVPDRAVPGTSHMNVSVDAQVAHGSTSNGSVAGSNTASAVQKNDDKTRKLYLIVYKFLQQQLSDNHNLDDTQKESLEVIVNCLGYAFQFFEFDYIEHTLPKIYDFFEKHKHDSKKKHVSTESYT